MKVYIEIMLRRDASEAVICSKLVDDKEVNVIFASDLNSGLLSHILVIYLQRVYRWIVYQMVCILYY